MCVDGLVRDEHQQLFRDGGRRKSNVRRLSKLERGPYCFGVFNLRNYQNHAVTVAHPCIGIEDGCLRKPAGRVCNNGEGGTADNRTGKREKDVSVPKALPFDFVFPWRCVNEVHYCLSLSSNIVQQGDLQHRSHAMPLTLLFIQVNTRCIKLWQPGQMTTSLEKPSHPAVRLKLSLKLTFAT